eukprot:scaffold96769_cov63-Cyclotella_meneghiniana.AAC.8
MARDHTMATPKRSSLNSSLLSSSRRSSSHTHILDDIRNDQELFFGDDLIDDDIDHYTAAAEVIEASATNQDNTMQKMQRLPSMKSLSSSLGRRTSSFSRIPMNNLQREVDLALEMFTRENSDDEDELLENIQYYQHQSTLSNHHLNRGDDVLDKPRFESEESGSGSSTTACTSLATSCDYDLSDHGSSNTNHLFDQDNTILTGSASLRRLSDEVGNGDSHRLSVKHRTKSIISLASSLLPSKTLMNSISGDEESQDCTFDSVVGEKLVSLGMIQSQPIDFHSIRNEMEPFLACARLQRDVVRQQVLETFDSLNQEPSRRSSLTFASRRGSLSEGPIHIGSNYGVPYPELRNETSFLYDVESYPLDRLLADTIGVQDLSKIHVDHPMIKDKARLMAPLQNRGRRRAFHRCFDSFVTSHVIPLLHSQALSKGIFYSNRHQLKQGKPQRITYRYQAFPTINIVRPGECSIGPHCDLTQGHSIGNISFHIPLTAAFGTNAVHVESRPGREDWHPLSTKSPGLGFQFDGARCLHFNLRNETDVTRVSINFSVAITRDCDETQYDPDDQLCCPQLLKDDFSCGKEGYYDEVTVSVGDVPRSFLPPPVAMKKPCSQNRLYDPDERLGFPFAM